MSKLSILEVGSGLPPSIGRCADLYAAVKTLRLAMAKEVELVEAREAEIREHIINNLSKSASAGGDSGAAGLLYRAQIVMKDVPKVSDEKGGWAAVWAFIQQTGQFDLLQKRLGEKAVTERWAAGESIPGVEKMNIPTVSITKI